MKDTEDIPLLSVVVPTYNRAGRLKVFLRSLAEQDRDRTRWELILVDDGSTDGTPDTASQLCQELMMPARIITQKHRGRSAARNLGIASAAGKFILVYADDIIASSGIFAAHLDCVSRYPDTASVGYVTWWPEMKVTPFMRSLEEGMLLSFQGLRDGQELDYRYAYSSNICLPAEFARAVPFDEDFFEYGFEDIEWGYRLQKAGLRFRFNQSALGYHFHPLDFYQYLAKMRDAGYSLARMFSKHPEIERVELDRATFFWRLILFCKSVWRGFLLTLPDRRYLGIKIDKRRCRQTVLDRAFIYGLIKGKKEFLGSSCSR